MPGLIGIWQKQLARWARRLNTQIKVKPTHDQDQMNYPVHIQIIF